MNSSDAKRVMTSEAGAASYRATFTKLASDGDLKNLDFVSSKPLEKNGELEKQLMEELAEEIGELPEKWMGLACIRCRKYDKERARTLMKNLVLMIKELSVDEPLTLAKEKQHIDLHKFRLVGRDKLGRACIATDLGYHNPKEVPPLKMLRTVVFLMLNALRCGPEGTDEGGDSTQLNGVCILHNLTHVAWANLDPRVPKLLFKMLSQNMPVRLGTIYLVNPPFFMNWVMLPMVRLLMPKKLSDRFIVVGAPANLDKYFDLNDLSSLPRDLKGRSAFDSDQWVETHAKDIIIRS